MPSANSETSPRMRLTMKPATSFASSGSSTALVPTRLAITPPRSMSPITTTGTSAARAKPILAMSFLRRLISDALPAPSTRTMSASCFSLAKLSSTYGMSFGFRSCISRAVARPNTLPCTIDLRADLALRLEQHRVHMHRWLDTGRQRLQRLRAADLAAFRRHGGVVRHVLRLERPDAEAALHQRTSEPGDEQRLADARPRALQHEDAGGHQYSMPACAFTPSAK